jgi:hypothetical protein
MNGAPNDTRRSSPRHTLRTPNLVLDLAAGTRRQARPRPAPVRPGVPRARSARAGRPPRPRSRAAERPGTRDPGAGAWARRRQRTSMSAPPKCPKTVNRLQRLITEWERESGQPVRRLNLRVASMMLALAALSHRAVSVLPRSRRRHRFSLGGSVSAGPARALGARPVRAPAAGRTRAHNHPKAQVTNRSLDPAARDLLA